MRGVPFGNQVALCDGAVCELYGDALVQLRDAREPVEPRQHAGRHLVGLACDHLLAVGRHARRQSKRTQRVLRRRCRLSEVASTSKEVVVQLAAA